MKKPLITIGKAVDVDFPVGGLKKVPARVDTGAHRSSVWASNIYEKDGKLYFTLLDKKIAPESQEMSTAAYEEVEVENSFGQRETRYSVYLAVVVAGRRVRTNFTLADRSVKKFPVLLGRKLLNGKFLVDVSKGRAIIGEDKDI